MSYVEKNLTANEQIIQKAKIHWFIYFGSILTFCFGVYLVSLPELGGWGAFLITLSLVLFLEAWVKKKTTELAVTNKRVIAKYGLIARKTIELNLNKVEGLDIDQGIMGRIFNFGNVVIGGTGGKKSPIKFIHQPLEFRKTVNEQIES